jgi:hypothetical protein
LSRSAAPAIPGTIITIERFRPERAGLDNDTPAAVRAQIERARRALCDAALTAGHDPGRVEVDVDAALADLADLADVHAYLGILAERAARLTLGLRSSRSSDRRPVRTRLRHTVTIARRRARDRCGGPYGVFCPSPHEES